MKTRWIVLCLVYITFSCNDHEVNVKSMEHANDFWLWAQAGQQQSGDWLKRTGGDDVVVDSNGNAYVVGSTGGKAIFAGMPVVSNAETDLFVAQFLPDGTLGWIRQVGDEGGFGASGVYLENDSILYVVGSFYSSRGNPGKALIGETELYFENDRDIILMALDLEGNILWAKQANVRRKEYSSYTMTIDSESNIYVAFNLLGRFGDTDIVSKERDELVLAKYDKFGVLQWVVKSEHEKQLSARAMAVDKEGNIYLGGGISPRLVRDEHGVLPERRSNFYIKKYNPNGNLLWTKTGEGEVVRGRVGALAIDSEGNILVTGEFEGKVVFGELTLMNVMETAEGGRVYPEVFFAKYDPNGIPLWASQIVSDRGGNFGMGVTVDNDGNSYFTGSFISTVRVGEIVLSGEDADWQAKRYVDRQVFLTKLDKDGNIQWARQSTGRGRQNARASAIAINSKRDYYITGAFENEVGFGNHRLKGQLVNMFIAKFNPNPVIKKPVDNQVE